MAVETADGRVFMTLRSLHNKRRRGYAWSEDGGYSWSRIQFDELLPDPPAQGSILRLPRGTADDRSRIIFANPASESDRSRLTIRMSEDECKSWPVSKVLYEGSSAYSDLASARDNSILCLYEADNYTKIQLARFNFSWIVTKNEHP